MELKAGQWLHASCSDEWYGPILRVGKDANNQDVIDIRLPLNDFLTYDHFGRHGELQDDGKPGASPLTRVGDDRNELAVAADFLEERGFVAAAAALRDEVLFTDLMWKPVKLEWTDDPYINLNPPGDGCYRCTQFFSVHDKKMQGEEWWKWLNRPERDKRYKSGSNACFFGPHTEGEMVISYQRNPPLSKIAAPSKKWIGPSLQKYAGLKYKFPKSR
ncbi:hypothetical protein AYO40_01165 [Planctomycetaceae bacterium SCGC AG-212-D15]|nr:hypothetical protein AYO40_01165 [Planctomycetaceae bacterium SCGC AG-212-D15]